MPKNARARNNRKKLQKFNPIKSVKVAKTTEHKPKPEAKALSTKNCNLDMREGREGRRKKEEGFKEGFAIIQKDGF
jgi:hypothetical protein